MASLTAGPEAFQAICMVDFLDNDRRPTFVVDLEWESRHSPGPRLHPVFYNLCLRSFPGLQHAISQDSEKAGFQWPHEQSYAVFKRWVCEPHGSLASHYSPATWRSMTWDATTVDNRYNVISARLGATPYTSSFMETLLTTGPARRDTVSESSDPSVASARNANTPVTGPSSTSFDASDSPHDRKASESYFSYKGFASAPPDVESNNCSETVPDKASANIFSPPFAEELSTPDSAHGLPAARYMQLLADVRAQREEIVKKTDLLDRISAIEAVAISVITADGELVFANDEWYRMCSFPKGVTSALAWMNVFLEEDLPKAYHVWETAMVNKTPIKFEARFKTVWRPPFHVDGEAEEGPTWISAAIYPDLSEEGEVVGGTGCIIDVSEQKWLQRVQARKVDQAIEQARLLEELNKQAAEAQRRAKEAHESDIRFQRLAEMMPIGIFIADKDRLPVYANRKFYDMFGIATDCPPTVQPWEDVFFAEDIDMIQEFWAKLMVDQTTSTFEARMKRLGPDQEDSTGHRWILCTGIPETYGDGSLKHITGCVIDVTKIKEAEEVQRQRVKDVTEARKQQEAFIDMTSHEIRNPLSSIVHSADEVIHCLSNLAAVSEHHRSISVEALSSAQDAADTILFCTQHSKRIIDDILCLSKLNSNLLPISMVPTEAKMAAEQVMKMFEGELRAAEIDWQLDFDDSLDRLDVSWVNLDTSRILQILVNLIGNSVKFTRFEEKPRQLRVSLSASFTKPCGTEDQRVSYLPPLNNPTGACEESSESIFLEYIVEDTGCGISAEGQKMLFNRFTQDSTRTHVKYGGNGLGLFISRQLCELQGGQMGFRSVEGQGSTFGFFVRTVRVSQPESQASIAAKEQMIATTRIAESTQYLAHEAASTTKIDVVAASVVPPPSPKSADVEILLVEDNLINQKVLGQQLRKRGYKVSIANHGEEALSHIQKTRLWTENNGHGPNLTVILMDIEMPILNGLDCARRIRELQRDRSINYHIPIVAITANARSQQIEDALQSGMDDLISKPFRIPELVKLIDAITIKSMQEQKG